MANAPVLIAGAGPCGLSAALFLTDLGVPVTVLEQNEETFDDPRAATFHPPTLEMLAPSGATAELHRLGIVVQTWQSRDLNEGLVAEFDLSLLSDVTPFPYRLQCEQHKLVRVLKALLATRDNCEILYDRRVEQVSQDADMVTVTAGGQTYVGPFLIGADGGRSVVRKSQGIAFEGLTYPERFLVATSTYDFAAEGFAFSCYVADPEAWCAVFKVPGDGPPGVWRVVFPTEPSQSEAVLLSTDYARRRLERFLPRAKPYEIVHTNLYQVHQRVAGAYRRGRVLLAGDAAHVNNPLGGMGMNFGIHDAQNLSRALAECLREGAPLDRLDRYDRQRRSVANAVLQTMTMENKRALEEKDPDAAARRREALRRTASDPALARAYLLRTSMIEGLRESEAIP